MIFELLFLFLLFLFGISIGSFIDVLVDRWENVSSIFTTTSRCPKCKKKIALYDLIPVVSYFVLKGKCRYCGKKIPKRVVIVEIVSGVLFVFVGLFLPFVNIFSSILFLLIISCVIALFFVDMEHEILPDYLLIILLFLSILFHIDLEITGFAVQSVIALGYFLLFLLLFLVTRGHGIGFGDVKYVFVIGILLGFPDGAVAIYLAFVMGALVSIVLIASGRKKLRGDTIPFGPFLSSGIIVMLLFSEKIYDFIFHFF